MPDMPAAHRGRAVHYGLAALLATVFACPGAQAVEFALTTTADTLDSVPGDGLCANADGVCSLRAAVQETNALAGADRIVLPAGDFRLTRAGRAEDFAASGDLDVRDELAIVGSGVLATRIDGNAIDTVFELHAASGQVRIEALTIANGLHLSDCSGQPSCFGAGGIVVRESVALGLRHVTLREHRANRSGSMSALLIGGCVDGDHVRVLDNGAATSVSAAPIGSVFLAGSPISCLVLDHGEIAGNVGDHSGALHANRMQIVLRRSLIHDNAGRHSGALSVSFASEALIENVTISGNRGGSYGALLNDGAITRIRHATISGNEGGQTGGLADTSTPVFSGVHLANSLVTGNRQPSPSVPPAPDCSGPFASDGGLLIGGSVFVGLPGSGPPATPCHLRAGANDQYPVTLALAAPADHGGATASILPPARAIDAGFAGECVAVDQRDRPRPAGACDLGAVEFGGEDDAVFADGFERDAAAIENRQAARKSAASRG